MEKVFNKHTTGAGKKAMVKTDDIPKMMREHCASWDFSDEQLNEVIAKVDTQGKHLQI